MEEEALMVSARTLAPGFTEIIFEVVKLTSATDEIVFHAEPNPTGYVYDNETLQRWYALPKTDPKKSKRPNAHGIYGLGQVFTKEHEPIVSGRYFGTSATDAKRARERLSALFSDGHPIAMSVTDEEGVTTRRAVWLVEYDAPFENDFSSFAFDLALVAPDPRRYGDGVSSSTGMPTAGSGLVWDLGTAPSGLFFDWGTPGESGQVSFTNTGNAESPPRIEVGGPGAFAEGFRVTEIETGRELTFSRSTNYGDVIVLDSRTERATLAGGDVTIFLTSRDWFSIPPGATHRYQINPLGGVTGTPTVTIYAAPANL